MTRKDYVLIAECFKDAALVATVAERLADTLAVDNPRFDRYRFMKACGFEAVEI